MAGRLKSRVLDHGLNEVFLTATNLTLCTDEPTNISMSSVGSANVIGVAPVVFSPPEDHASGGRCVRSLDITEGTIISAGTCGWYAVIDAINDRLLFHQVLTNGERQEVPGNSWMMPSFAIRIPS